MKGIELTEDSIHVEVIFGFLKQLLMICKRFQNVDDYIFCWDSKKSYRRKIYPEYKANRRDREKTEEEKKFDDATMNQFQVLRKHVLPMMGLVNNFMQTGIESDDVMASIIKHNPKHEYLMITSDQDMYQLLWHNLKIYSLHTRKIMDRDKFTKLFGINPDQWSAAKSISGCDTDNVKGIKGVADPAKSVKSLALQYLRGDLVKGKIYNRIISDEGDEIIKRNMKLIHLPFWKTKHFELKRKSLWRKDFRDTFEHYNFQSMLREGEFRVWSNIMNLN
jgi:hypothetical protein